MLTLRRLGRLALYGCVVMTALLACTVAVFVWMVQRLAARLMTQPAVGM